MCVCKISDEKKITFVLFIFQYCDNNIELFFIALVAIVGRAIQKRRHETNIKIEEERLRETTSAIANKKDQYCYHNIEKIKDFSISKQV